MRTGSLHRAMIRWPALLAAGFLLACCNPSSRSPRGAKPDAATARRPATLRVLFEEKSAFGTVYVVQEGPLRILRFGAPNAEDQSAYDPRRPSYEPLLYVRTALLGLAFISRPKRVLMIGLGGGSFLRHVRRWAPGAVFEAVEINPVVVRACRKHFGFARAGKVAIHVMDGRKFVQQTKARYDLVFLDAYDSVDYPRHLGTREFFTEVERILAPGGVVVANLSPNRISHRNQLVRTFGAVLKPTACFYTPVAGNTVVVGGPGVRRTAGPALRARVKVLERRYSRIHRLEEAITQLCGFSVDHARVLADPKRSAPMRPAPKKK